MECTPWWLSCNTSPPLSIWRKYRIAAGYRAYVKDADCGRRLSVPRSHYHVVDPILMYDDVGIREKDWGAVLDWTREHGEQNNIGRDR